MERQGFNGYFRDGRFEAVDDVHLGVAIARDHADAVREADLVFLAVTASSSLEAARSCLPGLRKGLGNILELKDFHVLEAGGGAEASNRTLSKTMLEAAAVPLNRPPIR